MKAKSGASKTTLILTFCGVIIFVSSHTLGVSVTDHELSRRILMFNMVDIFLPIFTAHCVLAFLGKQTELKKSIIFSYVAGIILAVIFIVKQNLFLLPSVPKMYFPNYYVPGHYYWVMLLFFFSLTVYFFFWMIKIYKISNGIDKNRIKYFSLALLAGYAIGSIDFLLIYNIQVDPIWGFLFVPMFSIPFTYAALQYDLLSISFVAQKAFVYAIIAGIIGGILSVLNYVNTIIIQSYPNFPNWSSSLILAIFTTLAVLLIWRKVREADLLKYEFINVVTHKFRTPLTSIKWTTENLIEMAPLNLREDIQHIQNANEKLVNLTNLLVNLSGTDDKSYEYVFAKVDFGKVLNECVVDIQGKVQSKNITLSYIDQPLMYISADEQKIRFIVQTILDNAVNYTPQGGKIIVEVAKIESQFSKDKLMINISDSGIGIPKNEIRYIFTKFYRATNGRKADTEGMGIGLYLAKRIIERHKGKISVESAGENKGSTFTIVLPLI